MNNIYQADFLKTNLTKFAVISAKKGQRPQFFILRPRSSKITPAKEKERRKKRAKRRKVGDEKKAMVTLLVFIVATLAIVFSRKKNCLTEEDCLAVKHFQKSG